MYHFAKDKESFFESIYNMAMEIPIGNIYSTTTSLYRIAMENKRNVPKTSHLFEEVGPEGATAF